MTTMFTKEQILDMNEDQLIDAQSIMISNLDSGTWEHTPELQELFDLTHDLLEA